MQVRNFTNSSELNSCELSDCIKPAQVLPKFVKNTFATNFGKTWAGLIQSDSSQEFNLLEFVKFRTCMF